MNNNKNNRNNDRNGIRAAILEEPTAAFSVLPNSLQGPIPYETRRSKKRVELSDTDLRLLSAIEVWGVLALSQIVGFFLPQTAPTEARVRLFFTKMRRSDYGSWGRARAAELRESGYIRRLRYANCQSVFLLTEKGRDALEAKGLRRLKKIRWNISSTRLEHEVSVAAVGLLLREVLHMGVRVDRVPYSQRRAEGSVSNRAPVPDLWAETNAGDRAIEVERNQKWWVCLDEKWPAFHRIYPRTPLLYLTTFASGPHFIIDQARRRGAAFVYVCDLNVFRGSLGNSAFVNHEGKSLTLTGVKS